MELATRKWDFNVFNQFVLLYWEFELECKGKKEIEKYTFQLGEISAFIYLVTIKSCILKQVPTIAAVLYIVMITTKYNEGINHIIHTKRRRIFVDVIHFLNIENRLSKNYNSFSFLDKRSYGCLVHL